MKISMMFDPNYNEFHPNDNFEGINSGCGGWQEAKKNPQFIKWIKTHDFVNHKYASNKEVYEAYIKESPSNDFEVQTLDAPYMGSVLLAFVEKLFIQVSEQASRGINTRETEEYINRIKGSIILLSKYQQYNVAEIPCNKVKNFDQNTKLATLTSFETDVKQYVSTDEGDIGLIYIDCPYYKEKLYIIIPPKRREINIQMTFDGEHFVAVYPDVLKSLKLPESITKNILWVCYEIT